MDLTSARKRELFLRVIHTLQRHFRLVNMTTHARAIAERSTLSRRPVTHPTSAAFTTAPAPAGHSRA
jgi:hypothetical protein